MDLVGYARYSSDNQRQESIDAQIRAISEYCAHNGHRLIKVYTDEAKSATTDNRPEFQRMIKDSDSGLFEGVIVHKLDRFSRDRYDSAFYKHKLKTNGVKVLSVMENLDGSPESIILESVIEGMAEYYSKNLAREVMKGLTENALNCKHTGGKPPFGFDIDKDKNYIINEKEAFAVKKVFEDYAKGKSYRDLIEWLNNNGYHTKYGNKFTPRMFHEMLHNQKYVGTYIYNKKKRVKRNGITMDIDHEKENQIIIENGIPAIIDAQLFKKVQDRLSYNKARVPSFTAKEKYLLSGKVFCGQCGSPMSGAKRTKKNGYTHITYQCSARKKLKTCNKKEANRDRIENGVLHSLEYNIFSNQIADLLAKKVYNRYIELSDNSADMLSNYESNLKEVNKQLDNIVNAIANGLFYPAMHTKMKELEERKSKIQLLIDEEKLKPKIQISLEQIKKVLAIGKDLQGKTFEEKRHIMDTFVEKVELFNDFFCLHVGVTIWNGDEGNRTPVRKPVHKNFSHHS